MAKTKALARMSNGRHMTVSPATFNSVLAGSGVVMGLIGFQTRETPVGQLMLGIGANLTAIGIAFAIHETFVR
jgi:hypothetical protein